MIVDNDFKEMGKDYFGLKVYKNEIGFILRTFGFEVALKLCNLLGEILTWKHGCPGYVWPRPVSLPVPWMSWILLIL